jgi:hypothetical protein
MAATFPDQIVLEIRAEKAGGDPTIRIYHVLAVIEGLGEWPETFGSLEQLDAYLKGITTILGLLRFGMGSITWDLPRQWEEPSGLRWTIPNQGIPIREALNSSGEVIKI